VLNMPCRLNSTLIALALGLGLVGQARAQDDHKVTRVVPSQIISALGCDSKLRGNGIGGADARTLMLYGYSPHVPSQSPSGAVFWCAQKEDRFLLVIIQDGILVHSDCSPMMVWHYPPKGLSFSNEPEDLGRFVYVDDVNRRAWSEFGRKNGPSAKPRRGPSGEKTMGTIIRDGDESLSNEFYCYKGAWMLQSFH
jgi:hypothetical protein